MGFAFLLTNKINFFFAIFQFEAVLIIEFRKFKGKGKPTFNVLLIIDCTFIFIFMMREKQMDGFVYCLEECYLRFLCNLF